MKNVEETTVRPEGDIQRIINALKSALLTTDELSSNICNKLQKISYYSAEPSQYDDAVRTSDTATEVLFNQIANLNVYNERLRYINGHLDSLI